MSSLPTPDQVRRLPVRLERVVTTALTDENEHMSLHHYVSAAASALWERQLPLGLARSFAAGETFFAAEQHTRYAGELALGATFTGHTRFLARSDRAMHSISYILSADDRLACSVESVNVFVSMASRRSVTIPPDLAAGIDAAIAEDADLDWSPALCGGLWR